MRTRITAILRDSPDRRRTADSKVELLYAHRNAPAGVVLEPGIPLLSGVHAVRARESKWPSHARAVCQDAQIESGGGGTPKRESLHVRVLEVIGYGRTAETAPGSRVSGGEERTCAQEH